MGVVRFYHLTQGTVEDTLPKLLSRASAAGLRVEIRSPEGTHLEKLDQLLWQGEETSFQPHGLADGPHDDLQPVLLTQSETAAAQTNCLMCIDGAPVGEADAKGIDRIFILFNGLDSAAVGHARGQWRAVSGFDVTAEYWSEESGRWEKKG